jgi:hypothetical protein
VLGRVPAAAGEPVAIPALGLDQQVLGLDAAPRDFVGQIGNPEEDVG